MSADSILPPITPETMYPEPPSEVELQRARAHLRSIGRLFDVTDGTADPADEEVVAVRIVVERRSRGHRLMRLLHWLTSH